jgi:competence protein ComEC
VCDDTLEEPAWFTGLVQGRPQVNGDDTILVVDLEKSSTGPVGVGIPVDHRIRLSYPTVSADPGRPPHPPENGQRIRFFTTLRRPFAFGNPGHFDYHRYLAVRKITYTARLKSGLVVHRITAPPSDPNLWFRRWVTRTVERRYGKTGTTGLDPPGALLVACLIGEDRWVNQQERELLRRSGLGHLLAISGLHLGLLGLMLTVSLTGLRVHIRLRRLILIIFFVAYHELCGARPSITRAVVAAVLFLLGGTLGVHPRPLNSVAAAALAMLTLNPALLYDAGWQLSFGATFSILILGPLFIQHRRVSRQPWHHPSRLASVLFGVSAAVMLGIAPVQALLFHRGTPAALLTNPAAGPLLGLSLCAGVAYLAAHALGIWLPSFCTVLLHGLAELAGDLVELGFESILWLARQSAHLSFRMPGPSAVVVFLYYTCLAAAVLLSRQKRSGNRVWAVTLLCCAAPCLLLVGAATGSRWMPEGSVRVTVLDVGQGDSTIIQCPGGRTMVIDGGNALDNGRFDFGEMAVSPALWSYGLHSVEAVALSHGHQDHAGGLAAVVRNFRPQRIFAGRRLTMAPPAVRALLQDGADCGARLVPLHRGMVLRLGEVELLVLHPPSPPNDGDGRPNNNSLVLLLRHHKVRMLFTGDLENGGEEVLLSSPLSRLIRDCQLIKVGHHGAADASSRRWLRLISPQTAVITAGRFNRFGHPDPDLRRRLQEAGCRRIHCTGSDGALVVVSDGRNLFYRTGPF